MKKILLFLFIINFTISFSQSLENLRKNDTINSFKLKFKEFGRGDYIIELDSKGNAFVSSGFSDGKGKYPFSKKIIFSKETFLITRDQIIKLYLSFYNSKKEKYSKTSMDGSSVSIFLTINKNNFNLENLNNPQVVNEDYVAFKEYLILIFGWVEWE